MNIEKEIEQFIKSCKIIYEANINGNYKVGNKEKLHLKTFFTSI